MRTKCECAGRYQPVARWLRLLALIISALSLSTAAHPSSSLPRLIHTLKMPGAPSDITAALITPDRKTLIVAAVGEDAVSGALTAWDIPTGKLKRVLSKRAVTRIALSPDGRTVVSDDTDRVVRSEPRELLRVWDLKTWHLKHTFDLGDVGAFAFSPDGKALAVGAYRGEDIVIALHDLVRWRTRRTFRTVFKVLPEQIAFSSDGALVVATAFYSDAGIGSVQAWTRRTGKSIRFVDNTYAQPLNFLSDNRTLVVGNATVNLGHPHAQDRPIFRDDPDLNRWNMALYVQGRNLCAFNIYDRAAESYTAIELWDVKQRRRVCRWPIRGGHEVSFSRDGRIMAMWAGGANGNSYGLPVRIYQLNPARLNTR